MSFDERRARWVLWAAVALAGLGLYAFVLRGADQPADPYIEPVTTTASPADGTAGSGSTAPASDPSVTSDDGAVAGPDPGPGPDPDPGTDLPGDPDRVPLEGFAEIAVAVQPSEGAGWLSWCLLAALEAQQRSRGLMEVTDLQGYSGMAFVYDRDVSNGFYMRNTPTPLSIAWIDADGAVVSTADMEPCEDRDGCPTYSPAGPYRVAIEVFQGDLEALGITLEATVRVGGACAPIG